MPILSSREPVALLHVGQAVRVPDDGITTHRCDRKREKGVKLVNQMTSKVSYHINGEVRKVQREERVEFYAVQYEAAASRVLQFQHHDCKEGNDTDSILPKSEIQNTLTSQWKINSKTKR